MGVSVKESEKMNRRHEAVGVKIIGFVAEVLRPFAVEALRSRRGRWSRIERL